MVLAHSFAQTLRTSDVKINQDVTFESMLLSPVTLKGLNNSGFFNPSPIQLHGIPLGKCGFDLLLEAKSGTGKTAVFTLIALEKIDLLKDLQVIIVAPTREIAAQICDVIKQIGSCYEGLQVEVVMGGLPIADDIVKLGKKVHILVGSPGRLKHLIDSNIINISSVRLLVLDEADKLMEKSFQADMKYIISCLPKEKQVIMSSATYPTNTKVFIEEYVKNAQHICPDSTSILLGISQKFVIVNFNNNIVRQTQIRFKELISILTKKEFKQCLIFCNYQARVGELHRMLTREGWPAEQLYGKQEQTERLDALKTLQSFKCRILISTDLAARGIDAANVDLVVNFEPPYEWQTYLHRIGRAGRFGSYGMAITIISDGVERNKFEALLSLISSTDFCHEWKDNDHLSIDINKPVEINSEISNSQITKNSKVENVNEELWKKLTFDESKTNIDSFENLCSLFNKSEPPKLESFSNLLDSFTQVSINNKDENLINSDPSRSCDMKSKNPDLQICKNNNLAYSENLIDQDNIQKKDSVTLDPNLFCKPKRNNKTEAYQETYNNNEVSSFDALAQAGLPTAFGQTKHKWDLQPRPKNLLRKSHESHKLRKSTNCEEYYTQPKSSFVIKSKNNEPIKNYRCNSKKYLEWYTQLKFTTKTIEQMIYIEELSKL